MRGEDGKLHDAKHANFPYPKAEEEAATWALDKSAEGREVYFCAHLLTDQRRVKENAASVLALWGELDGSPVPNSDLTPSAVVESSPGHYHPYWRLSDAIAPEVAERLNKRLAHAIGGDPTGYDLTQLLRVPGTTNHKYPERPAVRLIGLDDTRTYSPAELDARLPKLEEPPDTGSVDGNREPPVRLGPAALKRWRGEVVERKDGEVDRSLSLMQIALMLAGGGATERVIAEELRDRDVALGFEKYSTRRDGGAKAYGALARKARQKVEENRESSEEEGSNPEEDGHYSEEEDRSAHKRQGIGRKGISLPFRTAKEVAEETPKDVPWVCYPFLASGATVEFGGKIKLAGKTTLIAAMVGKMLDGAEFMGGRTVKTPVLYLTEQQPTSFRQVLKRARLLDREDLHVLYWHEVADVPWPKLVPLAVEYGQDVGAGVFIADTLTHWARVQDENSPSEAQSALAPLQLASATGMAVAVVRQDRKSGGEVGESSRGSSAFGGGVDHIFSIRRPPGNNRETVREIESVGRFEEAPRKLMIELNEDTGEYRALGSEAAFAVQEAMEIIVDIVPVGINEAIRESEVVDRVLKRLGGRGSRSSIQRALAKLAEARTVVKAGRGVKGDPNGYYKPITGGGVL